MRPILMFILLFLLSPSTGLAEPELKGTPSELEAYLPGIPGEVTLTGEAKIMIAAESGIVTMAIKTENAKLQEALKSNQTIRNQIVTRLAGQGIARDKINGTKFSSIPEYGFFSKKPTNYIVENMLHITIDNEAELQKAAGVVDAHKEVHYYGFELKEQDKEKIRQQLLAIALADAVARKNMYEDKLGIALKPVGVKENFSMERPRMRKRLTMDKRSKMESLSSAAGKSMKISLGEHTYRGTVDIRYHVMGDI